MCEWEDANSQEFSKTTTHPVVISMPEHDVEQKGGTMRLGAYPCNVQPGTRLAAAYGKDRIAERHRHRYEFNNVYREDIEAAGLKIAGLSPDGRLVEAVELPSHPFFVGVQYHPEFKSRPNRAHPLFKSFISAAMKYRGKGE